MSCLNKNFTVMDVNFKKCGSNFLHHTTKYLNMLDIFLDKSSIIDIICKVIYTSGINGNNDILRELQGYLVRTSI